MTKYLAPWQIRKAQSMAFSNAFAAELPEYRQFTEIVASANRDYLQANPNAEVDSEDRVLAEKHGAIRIGTVEEMRMVTEIFAVLGMEPVEFYDLTVLKKGKLPIIATAFRPVDDSIEKSAFRMFCSMLDLDSYLLPQELLLQVQDALSKRRENNPKFSMQLRQLLEVYKTNGGLDEKQAENFVAEVGKAFSFDKTRVFNFGLYRQLREINDALADIICLGINLNHLTPRAYDIRDAATRLEQAGIPMKDGGIEGPPIRDDGVAIQLNQTSRKAPGEWLFVSKDGSEKIDDAPEIDFEVGEEVKDYLARAGQALEKNSVIKIRHKARFGEIESRGVALTAAGEALYKAEGITGLPKTHGELFSKGLAYYNFVATQKGLATSGKIGSSDLKDLIVKGYLQLVPQTYNDFLAASAAGIFKSNMSTGTAELAAENNQIEVSHKNLAKLEAAMGRAIISRHGIHKKEETETAQAALKALNL